SIPLAMAPLGPDMLAAVLGELLDQDERAEVERGRSIDARAAVLGYCARVDVGVSGPAVTLRSAPAPAARKEARAPAPPPPTPPAGSEVSPSGSLALLLDAAVAREASDLFLSSDQRCARARVDGELVELDGSGPGALAELADLIDARARASLDATGSVDLALEWQGQRLRVNVFRHGGGLAAAARLVDERARSLAELGAPSALASLVRQPSGLVLVAGLAGHGKSTTLGALVDAIDEAGARHVITLEDPIERRFRPVRGLVHQREVGRDVDSFAAGLRAALRESPDVIVVGEMRDPETIAAALTAAETGHLVLSTVHAASPVTAIDRVIDGFSAASAPAIRAQLAAVLRAVSAQRLLPGRRGGRVAAFEVLQVTGAVAALIRDDRGHQLVSAIQTGKADGMISLDASLAHLVSAGLIERRVALAAARDRQQLGELLAAGRLA
ncbi:MAG TPA: PilT/PilU family type 4a pilus ATPase, partial [Kofleriaceae bacterium]|nr:PilT/PilU family type 4a pilus ATPase [Kofleriaceae bacterium]